MSVSPLDIFKIHGHVPIPFSYTMFEVIMLKEIVAEIAAVVVLWILSMLGAVIVLIVYTFSTRRKLFRFFGLRKDKQKLVVYLSTLLIEPGGSKDFRRIPRSYFGAATPNYELTVISTLTALFYHPSLRNLPQFLLSWLARRHWAFGIITPTFAASPLEQNWDFENFILVGSSGYNSVTDYYEQRGKTYLRIIDNGKAIQISRGEYKGEEIRPPNLKDFDLAILEKTFDNDHDTTVFIAAGLGINGTRGAIEYLVENWELLLKKYKEKEFALCIRFPSILADPYGFSKPSVIRQLPS